MTPSEKPIVLVDGSSYLYRAFHALPPLTNSKGEPTGAIYGVANMLRKLLAEYPFEDFAVIFDMKGKTFRNDIYPEYKAHRPPMADDLQRQIQPLYDLIRAMGFPLIGIEGIEADDIIGTLTKQAVDAGRCVIISTGDKDIAQLVSPKVSLIITMNNSAVNIHNIEVKFGVPAEQIIDYLALIGDTSDNIPGIPSVGPKTAEKWLKAFGSLDNLLAHSDKITGKVGEQLRQHQHQVPLARTLLTIRQDMDLPVSLNDLKRKQEDTKTLRELIEHLEFKRWNFSSPHSLSITQGNIPPVAIASPFETETDVQQRVKGNYTTILTQLDFENFFTALSASEIFAFDTETTCLDYITAEIVGLSFSFQPNTAIYLPLAHDYPDAPVQLDRATILHRLKPLFESTVHYKIGHHIKYDKNVLANYGINLQGIAYDTMLESYVLNSTSNRHNMDAIALKYLNHKTISFEDVAGKGAKQIGFNLVPIPQASEYAAEDADITLQLHNTLWPQLDKKLKRVFTDLELPLISVLSEMEQHGVLIDAKLLLIQSQELAVRMLQLEQESHKLAGQIFNLSSPKQLQAILYEKHNLPILQRTPTGQPSTGEEVLQELATRYPLPKLILEYRSLCKLKSTYTDRLPEQIDPKTGRVHTSYHQAIAATGRLSSSDPNLQNIPIRTEEGRRIRQAFIASPGYKLIAADYSQIELRIMAHLSQDTGLLTAFENNIDIHKATAAEVFGVSLDAVTLDERRSAKAINFGLIYGMSSFGLAKQLGISRKDAQDYINIYFARYPGVQHYMENTRVLARAQGYVETLAGRRLYLPEINDRNPQRRNAAERAAINAPLQGTAADIIKRAMINATKIPTLIMQVHDELIFEVPDNTIETAVESIRNIMTAAGQLSIPLVVDIGIGLNWDEAH
ncbi:MAG: DNA polymerase I [Gammaproteobacteria bacterium]